MTRDELIEMRNQVIAELIAAGMDEDDARFAAMTAAARPDGFLADQDESTDARLIDLANAGRAFLNGYEYVAPAKAPRAYEMEDGRAIFVS